MERLVFPFLLGKLWKIYCIHERNYSLNGRIHHNELMTMTFGQPFYVTLSSTVYTNTNQTFIANKIHTSTSLISCTFYHTAHIQNRHKHAGRRILRTADYQQILLNENFYTFIKMKYFLNTSETISSVNIVRLYVWLVSGMNWFHWIDVWDKEIKISNASPFKFLFPFLSIFFMNYWMQYRWKIYLN